ncbi:unnamed protein product [Eruca vesicaria subsp. sativa]|uniref:Uncharacterized protein n=1 Tax=Eruca vesicaria subsp. sativa TaxID=29727 RepID=A0ABC8LSH8_ERUVS|nr:unnamed protein product [Eruca vesicaria subsp. sativa]
MLGGKLDNSCPVGAYSISSGYNSTHILLNPTLDLIDQFKARYSSSLTVFSTQWSVGTVTSVCARFFVLNERLTIREIIDSTLKNMALAYFSILLSLRAVCEPPLRFTNAHALRFVF